jgi:hypothetical protein
VKVGLKTGRQSPLSEAHLIPGSYQLSPERQILIDGPAEQKLSIIFRRLLKYGGSVVDITVNKEL